MNKQKNLILAIILLLPFAVINLSAKPKETFAHVKQETEYKKRKPHIVFLITEDVDNYEAHKTVPRFAEMLKKKHGYKVSVLLGKGDHGSYRYPGMEILSKADLLVIFARRIALPHDQMNAIKNYLGKGKPLVGIRTANHAFDVQGKVGDVADGFEDWPGFVPEILGCENRGYGPTEPGTEVSVIATLADHPILKGLPQQWHSNGNIYHVAPLLDKEATVLLEGKVNENTEPIAWTHFANKSRVFYTSLGYPTDFDTPQFTQLLINGITWALNKEHQAGENK